MLGRRVDAFGGAVRARVGDSGRIPLDRAVKLESEGLRGVQGGQTFGPGQVAIVEQYRFEGVSRAT